MAAGPSPVLELTLRLRFALAILALFRPFCCPGPVSGRLRMSRARESHAVLVEWVCREQYPKDGGSDCGQAVTRSSCNQAGLYSAVKQRLVVNKWICRVQYPALCN